MTNPIPEISTPDKAVKEVYTPPHVEVGTQVVHKSFGEGNVTWIKEGKYIYVKFNQIGGKTFQFPEAFKQGFLKVKE
jgi:hypothetical protein